MTQNCILLVYRLSFLFCLFLSFPALLSGQDLKNYDPVIQKYSFQFGVDKYLVKSLILVSSGGNPGAVSASGAVGLMQLPPSVIKSLGVVNPKDADDNIRGGCAYLKNLMNQFTEIELAVAAFNAGAGEVQKYGKIPPIAETKRFVSAVMKKYKALKDSKSEFKIFGRWAGTARYNKYVSIPPLEANIVGKTQPFDFEIIPHGDGVCIKTQNKILGDPSLYYNVKIENERLHVEYKGPNPFGEPIPNTKTVHTLAYVLDLTFNEGTVRGEYDAIVTSKVTFTIPELGLPESSGEVRYTLNLNLTKR
jgi:hypothetical protein